MRATRRGYAAVGTAALSQHGHSPQRRAEGGLGRLQHVLVKCSKPEADRSELKLGGRQMNERAPGIELVDPRPLGVARSQLSSTKR